MQNQLKAGSFVGTKVGLSHASIFSLCTCYEMNGFEMTLLAKRTSELGAISIYLNKPSIALVIELPAASRILEPFGEVGGDVPEYFLSLTHFANIEDKKVIAKN